MPPSGRAAPLPPDERRAAIIAAATPLISRRGSNVTTREIAEAAGIAEGTIFRVFEDKESLLVAVVAEIFDPTPTADELRAIDPRQPLDAVITEAIQALRRRLENVWRLVGMLRMQDGGEAPGPRFAPTHRPDMTDIHHALADLLTAHRDELRWPPIKAARLLHLVTVASTHPILTDDQPLSTDEILDLLVHGVAADTRPDGAAIRSETFTAAGSLVGPPHGSDA